MEISGKPPLFSLQTPNLYKDDALPVDVTASGRPSIENDTVDLSVNTNEIHKMVRKVNEMPDVRRDRIEALKQRISSGTYRIKSEKIASQLIGETLENNTILSQLDAKED